MWLLCWLCLLLLNFECIWNFPGPGFFVGILCWRRAQALFIAVEFFLWQGMLGLWRREVCLHAACAYFFLTAQPWLPPPEQPRSSSLSCLTDSLPSAGTSVFIQSNLLENLTARQRTDSQCFNQGTIGFSSPQATTCFGELSAFLKLSLPAWNLDVLLLHYQLLLTYVVIWDHKCVWVYSEIFSSLSHSLWLGWLQKRSGSEHLYSATLKFGILLFKFTSNTWLCSLWKLIQYREN